MSAPSGRLRARLHEIIFEADTPEGRVFDLLLLIAIVSSVMVVLLESVASVRARVGPTLRAAEWGFTVLFTIEYLLRLATVRRPLRYALSPYGIIDLIAILPSYVSLVLPGAQSLLVIRLLRLLRIFRVLKMAEYLEESRTLVQALRASARKIFVFLLTVITIVVVVGTLMYVIEGEEHGFTNIPLSIYWAVVTLTTVGLRRPGPGHDGGSHSGRDPDVDRVWHHRGSHRHRHGRADAGQLPPDLDPGLSELRRGCARARRGVLPEVREQAVGG